MMNIAFFLTSFSLQYITAYVLNELEFHCLCVRNEIGRVCARNEQCVDYCVKLHTIANTITCKDLPMWKVSGKIVDGDANSYCQYTGAGFFVT